MDTQVAIVRARERYIRLQVRREIDAFTTKKHADWLAAIQRVRNVERHIRRLNEALSDTHWLAIYGGRAA